MKKLNHAIDRFCVLHPRFGIPNLMLWIALGNAAVFLIDIFDPQHLLTDFFSFNLEVTPHLHGHLSLLLSCVCINPNIGYHTECINRN